jgi:hypothetical protein
MTARIGLAVLALLGLAACDPGPTGFGTAPSGISQEDYDARVAADREARRDFYRGPRTGR